MNGARKAKVTDRRKFMVRGCGVFAACLSAPLWTLLGGCAADGQIVEAGPLHVPLDDLPLNRRVLFDYQDRTVEIVRSENGCRARVMLCTHQGCNIRWIEEEQIYLCACHEGRFNPEGQPIYGPPRETLKELTVMLTPTEAVIGG